jgi:hypothetical protein
MRRSEIFGAIDVERGRQDAKFPGQWARFDQSSMVEVGELKSKRSNVARADAFEMLGILMEEVGEVANAVIERDDANLTVELTQCAAVIVAWLEGRR